MPVPIPAITPNSISKGINWIAVFVHVSAVKGIGRVWLLGTIFIWGVRNANVQMPFQLDGKHW
jgi:hypothetical protein